MGWTKRKLVELAFEEIGLTDLPAEQLQTGMEKLDAMMAFLDGKRIRLGYPIPSSPEESNLDQQSGVKDWAIEAIYTNLAIRLGGAIGRTISLELKITARDALAALRKAVSRKALAEQVMPAGVPSGAGHKGRRFLEPPPCDTLDVDSGDELDLE